MEGAADYVVLEKGRGFVYAYQNRLYHRVKTRENVKYLKCCSVGCDGSAKLVDGIFNLGVSKGFI